MQALSCFILASGIFNMFHLCLLHIHIYHMINNDDGDKMKNCSHFYYKEWSCCSRLVILLI